jgi:SAM-dependent methyltransferase
MLPCVVCGATEWHPLPEPGPRSMVSDGRLIDAPLTRFECGACAVACRPPGALSPDTFESGYTLYAHPPGDTREQARQRAYARWIVETIAGCPACVLDVGCGNGSLLRALRDRWPSARLCGCDPAADAIAHGAGDGLTVWPGTAADLPASIRADLVVTINVIEHTDDPVRFLRDVRSALAADGRVAVVCPDGSRPGVELLFADHLFSFARPHLEALFGRAGLKVVAASRAPDSLGAFQMVVGCVSPEASVPARGVHIAGRRDYLERWRNLDAQLQRRLKEPVVCFGAGEAACLLRAYAPCSWSMVSACTADGVWPGRFGSLPLLPLDAIDDRATILVGVRPDDQPRIAERLRARFARVVAWYDLVDEGPRA